MTVKGITLTPRQSEVYAVLKQYGPLPDHALVPLAQHVAALHQSSSGIRSRRAELTDRGLVAPVGKMRMPSGRMANIFQVIT